jgi:acetyl coenzyme A synthetase (ADP forming)-like protein
MLQDLPASRDEATSAGLRALFRPRSVAVIGASRRPDSVGGLIMRNLIDGFTGAVYPVNPHAGSVLSVPAYASLRDVPREVDLAIVVVPASGILEVIEDCRAQGVKAVIVPAAGFAETGPEGRALQERLVALVREAGIRLVGPNCLGVINTDPDVCLNATFASTPVRPGRVAMSSQSGALGVAVLESAGHFGIGFSSFVSVGNKADVSGNDLLQYWEGDPLTDVILLYLESFGNPRRFARIARRVSRVKPILAVKSGRSDSGRRAAGSHTAALAGNETASDALCRQAGVLRCNTLEEMFEVAALLAHQPLPQGPRVGVLTNAGGPGILCADACEAAGLLLPTLELETVDALRAFLPAAASALNPVDMIATAGPAEFERAVPLLLDDANVDALVAIHIPVRAEDRAGVAEAIARGRAAARSGRSKPIVACLLRDEPRPAGAGPAETIPVYRFPESAARALGRAWEHAAWLGQPEGEVPALLGLQPERARDICRQALAARGECWLRADEVAGVLAAYACRRCRTSSAARARRPRARRSSSAGWWRSSCSPTPSCTRPTWAGSCSTSKGPTRRRSRSTRSPRASRPPAVRARCAARACSRWRGRASRPCWASRSTAASGRSWPSGWAARRSSSSATSSSASRRSPTATRPRCSSRSAAARCSTASATSRRRTSPRWSTCCSASRGWPTRCRRSSSST